MKNSEYGSWLGVITALTVTLVPVAPFYRLQWPDGTTFDYSNDEAKLRSEIAKLKQFNPVSAQPPLRWYFDPQVLEIEQRVLLDAGPLYSCPCTFLDTSRNRIPPSACSRR